MNYKTIRFYIAGPLFAEAERSFLENLVIFLARELKLDPIKHFFLPHRDAGDLGLVLDHKSIFNSDIDQLKQASIVVAVLDGSDVDSGTAAEIGFAYAERKAIFGLLTDFRAYAFDGTKAWRVNNMIYGMCDLGNRIFRRKEDLSIALKSYLDTVR